MEGEKILMAAGVTVAAVVGAFVFWGPAGSSRLRQRRGQIAGLHNFGRTCFLNTLLQALAACPQFIAWLQLYNGASPDKKSLITSLLNTLEVINGTHASLRGDPYSPGAVIRALTALGWVIPQEEHDAHELFHVLLASLEDESINPKPVGCLSDALPYKLEAAIKHNGTRPSSAMMTADFGSTEYDESTNVMRFVRSEAHTPDSPASNCEGQDGHSELAMIPATPTDAKQSASGALVAPVAMMPATTPYAAADRPSRPRDMPAQGSDALMHRRVSNPCRSLERLSRGPGRVSIWSDKMPTQVAHPFKGAMGSQIICSGCGYKSTVRYDKFDSVTLNLPQQPRSGLSLGQLLSEHITSEEINDVKCESCNETTNHTKSVTFAKLPACLCIHISRTVWLPSQVSIKRQDYVHFPESLSMAPYSFVQPHLNSQAGTPWGSTMSLYSSSLPMGSLGGDSYGGFSTFGTMFPRNLYRLLAVVVHSGEANTGHFVTYRRGALRNAHRWFYTSDTIVREVTIDEVLSAPAYMLFYDRSQQRHVS